MEFYYYFFTNTKYKFNVYVKVGQQIGAPLWTRTTSQGDFWRLGRLTVTSGSLYTVLFELASIMNGGSDDRFAIDDVFFTLGACQDSSDVNKVCTFSDSTLCGYTADTSKNFQWKLYIPDALKSNTEGEIDKSEEQRAGPLPIDDHTTNGGGSGYVYVQTNGFQVNNTAKLVSKVYTPFSTVDPLQGARCLEFYFYIQGKDAVQLNVKSVTSPSSTENLLWTRSSDHSKYWWKGEANIRLIGNYSVVFEAIVGSSPTNGLAALDDIILRNGQCSRY
jgi:hypothetical protein